jgi:hypothetical protein
MKLNLKEDPGAWRKQALLAAFGIALISGVLRWRHVLSAKAFIGMVAVAVLVAICAFVKPRWFRGYYRLSMRLGFYSSQFIGRVLLLVFFIFVMTPLGFLLRLAGKDPLQLKRPRDAASYWNPGKNFGPLDRLF